MAESPTPKKPKIEMTPEEIKELKERSQGVVSHHSARVTRVLEYEKIFRMEWDYDPKKFEGDWVQKLPSPKPHNDIKGIARLFEGAKATYKARSDSDDGAHASTVVQVSRALMETANRRGPFIPLYDLAMSAALFGEAYIRVANVQDNIAYLIANEGNAALIKRYQRLAREKPFVFRVISPSQVYPDYSDLGLESITTKRIRPEAEVAAFWGKDALIGAETKEGDAASQGQRTVEFWERYGFDWHMVWVTGAERPIVARANDKSFIPWAGSITEGTSLFDRPEDQRLPILYPVLQSGYWHAQSYADSIIYSLALTIGKLPQLALFLSDPADKTRKIVDFSTPMGTWRLGINEKIEPVQKQVIDQSLQNARAIVQQYMASMTIPEQVLGGQPENAMAFAAINMLVQAGRLPLVPIQRMVAMILAQALEIPWMWAKERNMRYVIKTARKDLFIDPDKYKNIMIEVGLNAQFAQDDAQRVGVAANAKAAGFWSLERSMEYTGVEDTQEEKRKIEEDQDKMVESQALAQGKAMSLTQIAGNALGSAAGSNFAPSEVFYRQGEDAIRLCGNCLFFRGAGVPCAVVNVAIDPTFTCNEWQPAQELFNGGKPAGPETGAPPTEPPAMFDPNSLQGGAGASPSLAAPGATREATQTVDRAGNPISSGQALPLG